MLHRLKKALRRDSGFTLTELVVAMGIIGILAAIAVPSFLGTRHAAYDAQAQAAVDAGLSAAQQHFNTYGDFSNSTNNTCGGSGNAILPSDLQNKDGNYKFVSDASIESANPHEISVEAAEVWNSKAESLGCKAVYVAVLSKSGTCWVGRLTEEGQYFGTDSGAGVLPIAVDDTASSKISGQTSQTTSKLNGRAYGAIKAPNSNAKGADSKSLADVKALCNADDNVAHHVTGTEDTAGVLSTEFAASWQEVVASSHGNQD